jgi:hypothetical protein
MPPNTAVCRPVAWRLKIGAGSTVRKATGLHLVVLSHWDHLRCYNSLNFAPTTPKFFALAVEIAQNFLKHSPVIGVEK